MGSFLWAAGYHRRLFFGGAISDRDPAQALTELLAIMVRLRDPAAGCPWDRQQSLESLRTYLLEEVYEVLEAIEHGDAAAHRQELGDLLFQIVFQCQIASEQGLFDFAAVTEAIAEKIRRRHPHVFGQAREITSAQVIENWERIKQTERTAHGEAPAGLLESVPRTLPALLAAHRLSERAARVGFDWHNAGQVMDKVREEMAELEEALATPPGEERIRCLAWELGDLLFALANLARHLGLDGETVLRQADDRFRRRFGLLQRLAAERELDLRSATIEELEALWQEAKRADP